MTAQWQPIATAPKDKTVLLYGTQYPHEGLNPKGPLVFSGYWDEIDSAWCSTGSTWTGPFYEPTHWMPLPLPPLPDSAQREQDSQDFSPLDTSKASA